jgi:hypothetical protein
MQLRKAWEKIISGLAQFDYLTAAQVTRLLYAPTSLIHVQEQMKLLVDTSLVITLGGKALDLPLIYTLSGNGRYYAELLDVPTRKRFRPSEEQEKGYNPYFLKHTVAVTDVLIAPTLLAQTIPGLVLTRMDTERQLRRKIYVELPERIGIEPDACCQFRVQEEWEDCFFIEVYRTLPPKEWRFKQKIQGYAVYLAYGNHEALFQTPALTIVVVAETDTMLTTLKRWTEEALRDMGWQEEGEMFFFSSLNIATTNPEELFLSPVWEQAFGTTTTPLLLLE